jgi:cyclic pyranopterin phosphate synthase
MSKLSHYDASGEARMVDVGGKQETRRTARAHAFVRMSPEVMQALPSNPKGDPLAVAKVAGILAAKRTAELIPMCHSLPLAFVNVDTIVEPDGIRVIAMAATSAQTGVEMEALTAVSVAALTIYDMTKALDKRIEIQDIWLLEKTGGKSGDFHREPYK